MQQSINRGKSYCKNYDTRINSKTIRGLIHKQGFPQHEIDNKLRNNMSTWIFVANLKRFRAHDFIRDYGFIEYLQTNKVTEGDIVYLYITAPYSRVEYKMIVERANIPFNEAFDDRAYSNQPNGPWPPLESEKFVRLKAIKRIQNDDLKFNHLQEHGLYLTMQSNRKISGEVADFIEEYLI